MTPILRNVSLPTGLQGMSTSPSRNASAGQFLMCMPDFAPWEAPNVFTSVALAELLAETKEQQNIITQVLSQVAAGPGFDFL
jgi:hypothetical protein